ncbi:MAG: 50S ribosomal protein L29 [Bacteroidota bacterium]
MASKEFLELQELSVDDLKAELVETERQFQKLKFDHAIRGLDNPLILRRVRRSIARIHTEIRRRELATMDEEQINNRSRIRTRRKRQRRGNKQ